MPNIQDKHFRFDEENEEYTCRKCGSTRSELEAIMHFALP